VSIAALRPCTYPGCPAVVPAGRCARHVSLIRKQRPTPHQLGYTYAWRKARAAYLRAHPLCVECEKIGKIIPADQVDHIIAHRGDKVLFWDVTNNWQSLCASCHSRKTVLFDGGLGR